MRIEDSDSTHYDQRFLCHVAFNFTANDDNIKY